MSKVAPYAEEILNEPEPETLEPWDAWRIAQKYGAPFWRWYIPEVLDCHTREALLFQRWAKAAEALKDRLGVAPETLLGKALDLGCGPVSMLEGRPGLEVVAIDPSMADYAGAIPDMAMLGPTGNCVYRNCMIQDVTEEDFDLVWCHNALDHAVDWQDIVTHIYRVLKPGGRLLLVVDVRHSLSPNKEVRVCHPVAFTAEELLCVLRAAGFHIGYHADIPDQYREIHYWSLIAERRA